MHVEIKMAGKTPLLEQKNKDLSSSDGVGSDDAEGPPKCKKNCPVPSLVHPLFHQCFPVSSSIQSSSKLTKTKQAAALF